jgi:hypothetical protein
VKTIADVLGAFGVPGMPLVKGAVDVYNAVSRPREKVKEDKNKKRIAELEAQIMRITGSPSKSNVQLSRKPAPKKQPLQQQVMKAQPKKEMVRVSSVQASKPRVQLSQKQSASGPVRKTVR